jgi:ribosomal protein S27AE
MEVDSEKGHGLKGSAGISGMSQHDKEMLVDVNAHVRDDGVVFLDGECPRCGSFCGNHGRGPLRCKCGWVGNPALSEKARAEIDRLFAEEFSEEGR